MKNIAKYTYFLFVLFGILCFFASCQKGQTYIPRDVPEVKVTYHHFDEALLAMQDSLDLERLYSDFPYFIATYTEDILGIHIEDTTYLREALPQFLNDTVYGFRQTNQRCAELFADRSDIETSITRGFSRLHYLYPDMAIPEIYFFLSGFNAALLITENEDIAVGIDMYLGSDYEYYNHVVYDYQKYMMRKACIPMDVVSAWLFEQLPYTGNQNRLIDYMIYRGKVFYLLSQLFDDQSEYDVIGYPKEKWEWAQRNEGAIWRLMIDKRDLWRTEQLTISSYLNDGPFTSEISQDSPARLGVWIGMHIVRDYMNRHPEVSLPQLMEIQDAQYILEESYYRP